MEVDEELFRELACRYEEFERTITELDNLLRPFLLRFVSRRIRHNDFLRDEVVQDTLGRILGTSRLREFCNGRWSSRPLSALCIFARNVIGEHFRRSRKEQGTQGLDDCIPQRDESFNAEAEEEEKKVERFLNTLPPKLRQLCSLLQEVDQDGETLKPRVIRQIMGLTTGQFNGLRRTLKQRHRDFFER